MEAVAETGSDACIFIYPGTYEGQVAIGYENSGNLTIYGSTTESVLLEISCVDFPSSD